MAGSDEKPPMNEDQRKSYRALLIMVIACMAVFAFGTGKIVLSIIEIGWHPVFYLAIAVGLVVLILFWRFLQAVVGYRRRFR